MKKLLLPSLFAALLAAHLQAADAPKPIKVLLITGGCCHDYVNQKDILKKGLEARANLVVEQIHTDDKSTKPPLPIYGNADYANGFDVVIHDECSAGVGDLPIIDAVLAPHRDGIPGVNLHCAMHSYRFGEYQKPITAGADNSHWYEYLGLQSIGHGPQKPIAIHFTEASPITKGFSDWTTVNEELYNNISILTGKELAKGKQMQPVKTKGPDGKDVVTGEKEAETVVAWTNEFGPKKTKVFSTTIGHNNDTVGDDRYLNLVTRGLLWVTGHLNEDGTPATGYGPAAK
jgi:hypothetical protein